ncbi:hypothetical protein PVK06_017027 [Gossypium arboreum]|uniref:Uncharacterized protein n=1 Tax=Gossypium arboreum TaxID=29729 RepID=A0ABR0Q2A8_GOSAR|nr:hypothetical protein PVK06_017027 [Gossypium arboreum]
MCRKSGEGRFIGCAQLLMVWFHGHFWKVNKVSYQIKRLAVGFMVTPEYNRWFRKRVNDNIPRPSLEDTRPVVEQLQLEEGRMHQRLDVDVQRLEAEKWRKGKIKVEEDLDSLKTDYKKLRLSMRTARLGKTSVQWH